MASPAAFSSIRADRSSGKAPMALAAPAAMAMHPSRSIDPYHLEAYGKTAVNYNRDIEVFPVLNAMFETIAGESPYKSPTDMGVNMAGFCVTDDEAVREAAKMEIDPGNAVTTEKMQKCHGLS